MATPHASTDPAFVRITLTLDIPVQEILDPDRRFAPDAVIPPRCRPASMRTGCGRCRTPTRNCSVASRSSSPSGTQFTLPISRRSAAGRWLGGLNAWCNHPFAPPGCTGERYAAPGWPHAGPE